MAMHADAGFQGNACIVVGQLGDATHESIRMANDNNNNRDELNCACNKCNCRNHAATKVPCSCHHASQHSATIVADATSALGDQNVADVVSTKRIEPSEGVDLPSSQPEVLAISELKPSEV